nr:MAG TPA: hypothetical protein [Caudoviricetes sp.]
MGFLSALAVYLGVGRDRDSGFSKSTEKFWRKLGVIPVGKN